MSMNRICQKDRDEVRSIHVSRLTKAYMDDMLYNRTHVFLENADMCV
jgi:hypothetical protein